LDEAGRRQHKVLPSDSKRLQEENFHCLSLSAGSQMVTNQMDKHSLVFNHYKNHIGAGSQRRYTINFQSLGWQPQQLLHLETPFSENEVLATIKSMTKEKAPGLEGFIGAFFSSCWGIIKLDIMDAISLFYAMNQQDFRFLNQALVTLIPNKANVQKVTDFRPISLIHSFGKIISKLLANRLAPELKNLISCNQSAFIKKRCLHNNFMFVHQVIKDLYSKKVPTLFLK
jgi:hypothetical protein